MWKNGFLAKIAGHHLCQEGRRNAYFRAHYLVWPKTFLGPKQSKPGKSITIAVSAEIAPNQWWYLFFEKRVFGMGGKSGFYWLCFEQLCSSENTIFIVFSAKPAVAVKKAVCWKKQKVYEKVLVVFEHGKKVFSGLFFGVLMFLWFVSVCLVKLQKC